MTLEDLDRLLPNGLHDAQIRAMTHDFDRAVVRLKVRILVGLPDEPAAQRCRYRDGKILFHRVLFCAVEQPENERILGHPACIWFTVSRTQPDSFPERIAKAMTRETQCYSLYILDWESQINIAAEDVSFSWLESESECAAE